MPGVTGAAGEPQIVLIIRPPVGPWGDVFKFHRPGNIRLVRETVTNTVRSSGANLRSQSLGERSRHYGASGSRKPRRTASTNASD
jgi:hypothetical protein